MRLICNLLHKCYLFTNKWKILRETVPQSRDNKLMSEVMLKIEIKAESMALVI